jgi:hypothetical protein
VLLSRLPSLSLLNFRIAIFYLLPISTIVPLLVYPRLNCLPLSASSTSIPHLPLPRSTSSPCSNSAILVYLCHRQPSSTSTSSTSSTSSPPTILSILYLFYHIYHPLPTSLTHSTPPVINLSLDTLYVDLSKISEK